MADTHLKIEPSILYFGTPVVLVSTCNEDETANIAPISSVFWLGWRSVLGISSASKTAQNMIRTGECVINIPSVRQVAEVDRLALLTGANLIPASKVARGYRYEAKKFEVAGLTPVESEIVAPPRAMECPVQMEAGVSARHVLGEDVLGENVLGEDDPWKGASLLFEMRILRIYAAPDNCDAGCSEPD